MRIILNWILILFGFAATAQKEIPSNIIFRDTAGNMVFDSLVSDLGLIDRNQTRITKYMMYIGREPVTVTRTWTSDPHFICYYPMEPIRPGEVYPITICFHHLHHYGIMNKPMGVTLSDGSMIQLFFKGTYPEPPADTVKWTEPPAVISDSPSVQQPLPAPLKREHKTDTVVAPRKTDPGKPVKSEPVDSALMQERMANFPGGMDSLLSFLDANFDRRLVSELDTSGVMVVSFMVNTDGTLSDFQVRKTLHPRLEKELIRVLKKSPKWLPQVCSKMDPGFYENGLQVHYYCPVVWNLPYRIRH